ncbi:bacteriochlorophyll 4-vinyl reductase [Thioflavicoccus mobilis 8321]|uniref:Bacteriochlorophyll 4-vinyl reductase n=1 Tax=Thioflavicoccus mobilis 8321 TaxID=765912 RepID=L0GXM7_9GAMM|nr:bacteriochlorophyll 4-vinyl reductase [Thioflavicoccus mobilis]AGA91498.1 bacteriochlorophyll 4-vinyl reductase [Thioflavicoccus mobilis 8321]
MATAEKHLSATDHHPHGRIGPNAIIRIAEALRNHLGEAGADRVFSAAGLSSYLLTPPEQMVDEGAVSQLHGTLFAELGDEEAKQISWAAGQLTGDYLLAHRIPPAAQRLLRFLPPTAASRVLLKAIGNHAWTFSGTGTFAHAGNHPIEVSIANCPICRQIEATQPVCDFYAGTFERIFKALVSRKTQVHEVACQAAGAPACRFEIRWR